MANTKNTNTQKPKTKKRYATHITTPDGNRVYISAKSQEELDKKVLQAKMEMGAGVDISDNSTFEEYANLWLQVYKAPPKLRQNSYDTLKWHLDKNILPVFKGVLLKDVKPIHIQKFMNSLSPYGKAVQTRCLQAVRAIFRTAVDNGLIAKSPVLSDVKAGGTTGGEKVPLTKEQANQLLEAVKGTRAYLFCLLALTTGLRRSEILGLMWEDVDFDSGYLTVTHSKALHPNGEASTVSTLLKSDAAHRRIPIPLILRVALEQEKKVSKSDFVLSMRDGSSVSWASYQALWRLVTVRTESEDKPLGKICKTNNGNCYTVTLDFHCSPHLLRHTCITSWFEAGLDLKQVQYLAGHSTPEMTLKVYTHYRRKAREKETEDLVLGAASYLKVSGGAPIIQFPAQ